MKIAMIGTGYVGLVTGTCLADSGNEVTCVDIDQAKIERLEQGVIPIFEPGLSELVVRNAQAGRLRFTTRTASAVASAQLIFLAVGTPSAEDGSADLKYLWSAVESIAPHLAPDAVVVVKSTVPVGTNAAIFAKLAALTGRVCDVASNPEFLKEGAAINDFQYPDRVVVGVRSEHAETLLQELYGPYLRTDKPFLSMTPESAELTKYVANALLSTKISFINEMANLCERLKGDINDVRRGIGHDRRIGFQFLFPGVGYGGSCFPKDVRALANMARKVNLEPRMLLAVDEVNNAQKSVLIEKISTYFGEALPGRTIAIWGLAFKPRTDDIREAPALVLIDYLLEQGCRVIVHDPEAIENVKQQYGSRLIYCTQPMDALEGADALAINTEWGEFRNPNFDEMRRRMKQPVIFDGRNLYEPEQMRQHQFVYHSIGRIAVE
ncbi:nucleotide sugar dehydrogenase [Pirellula staleyi DSM 6068]|uniref:UDP-glucose 6-dehydrogenase n=1 Tax=Pirellula staleyi (strain ATCC 27377 / DSM 6068 / ICPB 4128) TaxID=530564 RepID=D2QWT0_PIRSD|nr:UDP-glucose/GDP-mannose dehydrogenase family protein [Pirellula staleyi]ADB16034.1 nucleotide sugar dehydrogenase [Pirellula staleyi DSM 6068]